MIWFITLVCYAVIGTCLFDLVTHYHDDGIVETYILPIITFSFFAALGTGAKIREIKLRKRNK